MNNKLIKIKGLMLAAIVLIISFVYAVNTQPLAEGNLADSATFSNYGLQNEDSSISRTVSLPAAIAVKLILQNKFGLTGVHIPVLPGIYNPILDELKKIY